MRTYVTRLTFESQEDFSKILEILELHRDVVNFASEKHFGSKKNSLVELHAKVYHKIRTIRPEIPSCVVVRAINECLANYRSIKSNKHVISKPVEKKNLSIRLDKNLYKIKGNKIKLSTTGKRIEASIQLYPKLESLMNEYMIADPLLFMKNGEIWIALTFKTLQKASKKSLALGVDLGIKRFVTTSEGKIFKDKKFNGEKRRLRYLKRKLNSKGTKSARKHLKKLKRKERNKNRNMIHQAANWLLSSSPADVLVFEDLSGIKKKKKKNQNKNRISQLPWFLFKETVTYKAHALGKDVQTVSAAYTSQIDHRTGRKKKGARRGCRYYSKNGLVWDADWNAAINIAKRSKLPVSWHLPVDGQVVVTQPIVCQSVRSQNGQPYKPTTLVVGQ